MEQNHNGSEQSYNYSSSSALHFPLISNNSFELNAISLSDDSGFTSQNRENEVSFFAIIVAQRIAIILITFSMLTSTPTSLRSSHNSIRILE